jgi:dTDP-D-glucose 4,6-dehydratase
LQRAHALAATVTKAIMASSDILTVWGTGEEKRDLLYVSDMVKCIEAVIKKQKDPFKLYNIGLGKAVSIIDMVQKIINISGKSLTVEHDQSKPSNKTAFCLDISKVQQELKWSPKIELEEGIRLTIKWYKNNIL